MAKKNNSIMGGAGIALMAILVSLFTSKKFLIALGILIVFIIIYAIIKSRKQNQQSENGISTSDSEMPGNVAYFISAAQDSETQKDFLAARINYMKAVEELKRCTEPTEYEKLIIPVQKMYDEFVLRDPVYKYLMSKLLPIIENQNGILQSEISKDFESVDWGTLTNGNREVMKEDIYYALYFADRFGHIKRIKKGRSYQLFLPDTNN